VRQRRVGSTGLPATVIAAEDVVVEGDCRGYGVPSCEGKAAFITPAGTHLCETCVIRRAHRCARLPEHNADGSVHRNRLGRPSFRMPKADPLPRMVEVPPAEGKAKYLRYGLWLEAIAPLNDPYARVNRAPAMEWR